jgi:hypothetical protein
MYNSQIFYNGNPDAAAVDVQTTEFVYFYNCTFESARPDCGTEINLCGSRSPALNRKVTEAMLGHFLDVFAFKAALNG